MRQYGGRQVWVHLPASFESEPDVPRHLLILHDGQNLTTARAEALGGSWLADETVDRLSGAGEIPPLVVAGIDHAGEGRIDEFGAMAAGRPNPMMVDYTDLVLGEIVPALAKELGVPAYIVFGDATLRALAALRPESLADLDGVTGIGAKKREAYGEAVLEVISAAA